MALGYRLSDPGPDRHEPPAPAEVSGTVLPPRRGHDVLHQPAVFDDPEARQILLEVARQKHVEIGMHIHPWNTPPYAPDRPVNARDTFVHNLPSEVVLPKLES